MRRLRVFLLRVRGLVRPREPDDDLNEEIAGHLAEAAEEYRRQGLSPKEARLAALSSFGSVTQVQEAYWDVRSFRGLDDALRDLQYAVRTLRRAPHFTVAAVFPHRQSSSARLTGRRTAASSEGRVEGCDRPGLSVCLDVLPLVGPVPATSSFV
jgi:hypothetical protein